MPKDAKPKTASRADRASFHIAGTAVPPGTMGRVELPAGRLASGTSMSLPVAVLHGRAAGPTLWLSSALHGDELNGIPIIHGVLKSLSADRLAGTVVAVPVVNVFGLVNKSRYLPDRRDLNRCFPGSRRGSLASQLAHLFMTEVVNRCDIGVDLHTGSDGRANLPHLRCDLEDAPTREGALQFAPPVLVHASVPDGSLRHAARRLRIPVFLYEAGEAHRFDPDGVRIGVQGILRLMRHLRMTTFRVPHPRRPPRISYKTTWIRAKRSGFCELTVKLGEHVRHGQQIGVLLDPLGDTETPVSTDVEGVVLGCQNNALIHRGDAIAHIATLSSLRTRT